MDHLAELFVQERARRGLVGRGKRVPEDLRRVAERFAGWKLERGVDPVDVAQRLGITEATLVRWLKVPAPEDARLRRVVVREAPPPAESGSTGLTLVTPDGFRIEGVTVTELPDLIHLLR